MLIGTRIAILGDTKTIYYQRINPKINEVVELKNFKAYCFAPKILPLSAVAHSLSHIIAVLEDK